MYEGSGRKQAKEAPLEQTACKKNACAIQRCLARHNHRESHCREEINAWKECARKARETEARAGKRATSE